MPQTATALAGRYELGPVLGRGGMAHVHRGRDLQLGRPVAVKVLAPPFDRDRAFVERLRREARAAARLNHPNIVAVYDAGSDGDRHFIVTELVEGETLAEVLARGPIPARRAIEIAIHVCRALAAAHQGGVVHRDVKPGNVMLTASGGVKVVDFGIAKAAGAEAITRSGLVLGSASYLSPEQARGEPGDERSDLYAVGCVIYQMLTGQPPFAADSPVAVLYLHVNERPEPPSSVRPVPARLEAIVLRCLEKDPDRRFGSAGELELALADVAVDEPTATLPLPALAEADEPTRPVAAPLSSEALEPTGPVARSATAVAAPARSSHRPSRRWLAVAAAVGALALVGLAVAWLDDPTPVAVRESTPSAPVSPSESPTTAIDRPLSLEEALTSLSDTILGANAAGQITGDGANKLFDRVAKVIEHYEEGQLDDVEKDAEDFFEELTKLNEEDEVSDEAAERIAEAFDGLLLAIDRVTGDDGEGGGPPPHANAGGQDDDEDD